MKLNLGCGNAKIEGFVNIDSNSDVKPDLQHNIVHKFPYEDESIEEIWMIHVIEHIQKKYHMAIFKEVNRLLQLKGILVLAYPEFARCATNYLHNVKGKRDFWEMTIYGRQQTPSDFHVSIIDTPILTPLLVSLGFSVTTMPQEDADFYTVMKCVKMRNVETREDIIRNEVFNWG